MKWKGEEFVRLPVANVTKVLRIRQNEALSFT